MNITATTLNIIESISHFSFHETSSQMPILSERITTVSSTSTTASSNNSKFSFTTSSVEEKITSKNWFRILFILLSDTFNKSPTLIF